MTNESEYCAECGFITTGWPEACTCRPCGQKVCDRYCLAEHKRYCAGAQEAKARKAGRKR